MGNGRLDRSGNGGPASGSRSPRSGRFAGKHAGSTGTTDQTGLSEQWTTTP
jgi:hypothetical protein